MSLRWQISQFIFPSESVTSICEVSYDVFVSDGRNMWLKATAWRRLLQPKSWADLNFSSPMFSGNNGPHGPTTVGHISLFKINGKHCLCHSTQFGPNTAWDFLKVWLDQSILWMQYWWLELSWSRGLKITFSFSLTLYVCVFNVHYWKEMSIAKMRKILQSAMLSKNCEFNEGESRFQKKQTKKYLQRCHSFKFRDF